MRTRTTRTTASAEATTDLALEERQDVDLDARDRGGVAGTPAGRHVHDVEGRKGGDDRDRDAHADLVAEARAR